MQTVRRTTTSFPLKLIQLWTIIFIIFLLGLRIDDAWACTDPPPLDPSQPTTSNDPSVFNNATRNASLRACAKILKRFSEHLTAEQQQMLEQIDISITGDTDASQVYASKTATGRKIEVSVGFIGLVSLLSDIDVFFNLPNAPQRSYPYVEYISKIATDNAAAAREGKTQIVADSFPRFLGLSQSREKALYDDARIHGMRVGMYEQNLALTLGHELAHHFFKHVDSSYSIAERRLNESAADLFAVNLAIKSGYQPYLARFPFLLFVQLEEIFKIAPNTSDHPEPSCRLSPVIQASISAMRADKPFIALLKEQGTFDAWDRNMTQVQAELVKRCGSSTAATSPSQPKSTSLPPGSFSECMQGMPSKCLEVCLRRGIDPATCETKACRADSTLNQQSWTKACMEPSHQSRPQRAENSNPKTDPPPMSLDNILLK
jgi:hypothetical protein